MCSKDLQSVLIFLSCKMKVDILCVCICVYVCVYVCVTKSHYLFFQLLPQCHQIGCQSLKVGLPSTLPSPARPPAPPHSPLHLSIIYLFIIVYLFCPPLAKCMRIAEIIPAAEVWQQHSLFQLSPECVVSDAP